jgi:hypothetical protein
METLSRRWVIPLCGIASMLAFAVHAIVAGSIPADDASAEQLMAYATRHDRALLASAWLDGLGAVLLVLFVVGVVHRIGTGTQILGRVALMGVGLVAALSFLAEVFVITMGQAGSRGDTAGAVTAFHLTTATDLIFPLANVVWVTALAVLLLRAGLVPAAIAYIGIALGASEIVLGPLALATSDKFHWFIVLLPWVAAAAVALGVRGGPAREPAPGTVAGAVSAVRT